jgi:hypothetical protein
MRCEAKKLSNTRGDIIGLLLNFMINKNNYFCCLFLQVLSLRGHLYF